MTRKIIAVITVFAMLLQLTGWLSAPIAHAATTYTDVYVPKGGKIVNRGDMTSWSTSFSSSDANNFGMFKSKASGVTVNSSDVTYTLDSISFDWFNTNTFTGKINISQNPELKRLAQGGTAKLMLKTGKLDGYILTVDITLSGTSKYSKVISDGEAVNSGWIGFGATDTITIEFNHLLSAGELNNIQLYFADIDAPVYQGNTFTTDGSVRFNDDPAVMQNELFLKQDNMMNMALNFSEPVFPSMAVDASDRIDDKYSFMRTELFTNPGGDGYDPSTYYLTNTDDGFNGFTLGSLNLTNHSRSTFNLKFTTSANDSTGNVPLDPLRLTASSDPDRPTLLQRINDAGFIDGAGNPLQTVSSIGTSPFADNSNPNGTYRTIIDARPPKYSAVKNGVQPNILTGLVLNKGNTVTFNVNVSKKLISANAPTEDTRLTFSNGMTASYVSGSNTDTWTFQATVPGGTGVETALLNTSALEHASDPGDGKALWDYAHNYLTEAVKSIDWADLSIDNTAPEVNYVYKNESGVEVPAYQHVKNGSIAINAYDPDLNGQPSKGLFRPGAGSGLVYYWLSKSPEDPFAGMNDNYAAVKRYSLTQKQPSEDLYASGFEDVILGVAENGATITLPPEAAGTSDTWYLHTWTADMTWDSARQLMQYDKGSTQRDEYLLQHPDATPAETETNFRQNIMPGLGEYDNLQQWPLSDYSKEDSNWSYHRAVLNLDNDAPVVTAGDVVDNMTDNVKITITAIDPTSSIKDGKIQYQFVKQGAQPNEAAWLEASLNEQGKVSVATLYNPAIDRGGKYELYAKATDIAGNAVTDKLIEVDVLVIFTEFQSYPGDGYAINNGPEFTIAGVPIDTVEYQYTDSSVRPEDGWDAIEQAPEQTQLNEEEASQYQIPADQTKNGTVYAHIKVKQKDMNRYYYYYKEYKFDHLPPTVTFSSQGYLYPMAEQSLMIAVEDSLVDFAGVAKENIQYQWIKVTEGQAEQAPDTDSNDWQQAPASGEITLSVDSKDKNGNYRLYVYAKDSLGNGKVYKTSGLFATFLLSADPPVGSAELIHTMGNAADGYTAIMKLEVDVPAQEGYFYSISSNGGDNWSTWRPFTNYVGVPVDTDDTNALKGTVQVKFKGYYDNISEIYSPSVAIQDAPAYALASLDQIDPVRGGARTEDGGQNNGLDIVFDQTDGKTITPTDANPEMPETIEDGKRYKVYRNGSYSFTVEDGGKSNIVFIVVSNFDDQEPIVSVKYSTIAKTSGTVVASLQSSKPIRITNLSKSSKTFTENGDFTFEYEDAVGFTGTIDAHVSNIMNTPPDADVVLHYNHSDVSALIRYGGQLVVVNSSGDGYDAQGELIHYAVPTTDNVVASNLVVAEVRPKAGATQDYQVAGNNAGSTQSSVVLRSNAKAFFTIVDAAGNSTKVESDPITTLVSDLPEVKQIVMERIDSAGNVLQDDSLVTINGKSYSKGKIRVSFELEPSAISENTVTIGGKPADTFRGEYDVNMRASLLLMDRLGNRSTQSFVIDGLDNTAPEIKLNKSAVSIMQSKSDFDFVTDLGGYEVSDNLSAAEDITVTIVEQVLENGRYTDRDLDLTREGKHTVKYIARDQVGNESYATQLVYVTPSDGMFITANGIPLSEAASETAIVNSTTVTFNVQNYNLIKIGNGTGKLENEEGTFDLLYYPGLVREGEMKYIATKLTYEELMEGSFTVTLPKAGWYTIIVRTQEREQIYTTLLVSRSN
ncbi:hypothetical protein DFQ01_1173 [Paenibacillus cellulosilyticus]|uniref:Ig-like domain-containing protein n=1 Tax=Paenibacillus cellulosilyticus TaxID=375489 RepID=A0A2V2YR34_9BACL|nr:hypothetical protein [Paenibacillus cellulosilyticus]PWV98493.1 hypothetical protein DFQ01_1173 [Paenibacillus cellulosilyticus]QKS44103.1 hypothetical protein HUB94_06425 [Paenibacillus cellulosilyticus]